MKELINKVEDWAVEKGLLPDLDIKAQFNQFSEELSEVIKECSENNIYDSWVEIGDCLVVLIIEAKYLNVDLEHLFLRELDICSYSDNATCFIQLTKEHGLLVSNVKKNNKNKPIGINMYFILDALKNIAKNQGTNLEQCLKLAYDKISKRKGKIVKGQFIKEQDLKPVNQ